MITYKQLVESLQKQNRYDIVIKKNYIVINIPGYNYHITIFEDQWNEYWLAVNSDYHLFHISSNDSNNTKCSSYFRVDFNGNIHNIPAKMFLYNQDHFSFFASTRSPCNYKEIKPILIKFQKLLKLIFD
jgi:hypothetical protein